MVCWRDTIAVEGRRRGDEITEGILIVLWRGLLRDEGS